MSIIDSIKDKIEEMKEIEITWDDIKEFDWWWFFDIQWKFWQVLIFTIVLWLNIFWWYFLYKNYEEFKLNKLDNAILAYNNEILNKVYNQRKWETEKFKKIKMIEWIWKPSLSRLVCLFLWIRNFDLVNKKFAISQVKYNEKNWKFEIKIQWIKYYNNLIKLILLTKLYKDIFQIDRYTVKLVQDNNWWSFVSYYNVDINWNYKWVDLNRFKSIFTKIGNKKTEKKNVNR